MSRETVHNGKKLHVTRIGLRIRLTRDHFHWGKLKVRKCQALVQTPSPNIRVWNPFQDVCLIESKI